MTKESYPRRGEIYLVDFSKGASGSEQKGYRPALVIQNNAGNKYGSTVIIASLTSQFTHQHIPTNVLCAKQESGLNKDSVVNLSQIRTIVKERLKKKIAKLNEAAIAKVNRAIAISLNLINLPDPA